MPQQSSSQTHPDATPVHDTIRTSMVVAIGGSLVRMQDARQVPTGTLSASRAALSKASQSARIRKVLGRRSAFQRQS